jgi:hypothetical protein
MASELFNSLSGYSVGIPPVNVIDSNGNIVSNFLNLSGNVSANKVYANSFFYANGQPFNASPGGIDTQLQFNNNGVLGGIPDVTYNGSILNLGDISTLNIGGGLNGYFLQTDGAGNLTWAAGGGGGGNGNPGGANTQIQFNDAGVFGGDSGFTYNKNTNTLHVENISAGDTSGDFVNIVGNLSVSGNISLSTDMTVGNSLTINNSASLNVLGSIDATNSGNISLGNISNLHVDGGTYGQLLATDGLGNLYWSTGGGGGNGTPGGVNQSVQFNEVGGFAGDTYFVYDYGTRKLSVPSIKSNVAANFVGASSVNLGSVANLHISGGFDGYVLVTDGSGNLSWSASGGGGNGVPGGSNTQVQFNDNGEFGADAYFTYNNYTHTVQVGGNLIANSFQIGAGAYKWSTSLVYFASTASTASQQVLYSVPVSDISGVEFEIIATEPAGPSRQSCKISSLYYDGTVQYTEFASLFVNGGVGNFEVDYNAGDIITPPSLELKVSPNTSNPVTYKMLISQFAP